MSRRKGEFAHRTSIFEGAYRAWSHLGGLEPHDIQRRTAADLDPLEHPILGDPRVAPNETTTRRIYPYEPLPRSGLSHPFVKAILNLWLRSTDHAEALQVGLNTLRIWWQHRKKSESRQALVALGTEEMQQVVDGYTRHFFTLVHCLMSHDKVLPPRTLYNKMQQMKKTIPSRDPVYANLLPNNSAMAPTETSSGSRLSTGVSPGFQSNCMPSKFDLPGVLDAVRRHAAQFVYHGIPSTTTSGTTSPSTLASTGSGSVTIQQQPPQPLQYGDDPSMTPVVFASSNGDLQIIMQVTGIICAHCVKIVETVLRGCAGTQSPIVGLIDAAADQDLSIVLVQIDRACNAPRIAQEAARNLSLVGYTAQAQSMKTVVTGSDESKAQHDDRSTWASAFEIMGQRAKQRMVLDWTVPCRCPDSGVFRHFCPRHSQMNPDILAAFTAREQQVHEYMASRVVGLHSGTPMASPKDFDEPMLLMDQPIELSSGWPTVQTNQPPVDSTMGYQPRLDDSNYQQELNQQPQQPHPSPPNNDRILSFGSYGNNSDRRESIVGIRQSNNNYSQSLGQRNSRNSDTTYGRVLSLSSSFDWGHLEDLDFELLDDSVDQNHQIIS